MLADRFAETDPKEALRFAEEAAVQARGWNQPHRALAMARARAVLVKLGRGDVGRKLIDEALKIIEDMKRDPATIWPAEAYGWLAVALAPRDPGAGQLLDRPGPAMMIYQCDWAGRSAGAAHIALCARRIGYPDMESVVMRVLAARPTDGRNASTERTRLGRAVAVSTVSLSVVDPEAARTVLDQLESRAGFDLAAEWSTREPWLIAFRAGPCRLDPTKRRLRDAILSETQRISKTRAHKRPKSEFSECCR
jgi:hypothetical protein